MFPSAKSGTVHFRSSAQEQAFNPLMHLSECLKRIVTWIPQILRVDSLQNENALFLLDHECIKRFLCKENDGSAPCGVQRAISNLQEELDKGDGGKFALSMFSDTDQKKLGYAFYLLKTSNNTLGASECRELNNKENVFSNICGFIFPAVKAIVDIIVSSVVLDRDLKNDLIEIYFLIESLDRYVLEKMCHDIKNSESHDREVFHEDIRDSISEFIKSSQDPNKKIADVLDEWLKTQTVDTIIDCWRDLLKYSRRLNLSVAAECLRDRMDNLKAITEVMAINPLLYAFVSKKFSSDPRFKIECQRFEEQYKEKLNHKFRSEESTAQKVEFESNPENFIWERHLSRAFVALYSESLNNDPLLRRSELLGQSYGSHFVIEERGHCPTIR